MKATANEHVHWYDRRGVAAGMAVVALSAAYLVGSRALGTGSLQQYAVTIVLTIVAVRSIGIVFRSKVFKKKHGK